MDPARRRRKQRHRAQLMSGFAVITLAALVAIGYLVVRMNKLPAATRLSAATSGSPRALADRESGLSYNLLPSPWRKGCPMRDNPVRWSGGEGALAGHVRSDGQRIDWWANACSGVLPQRLQDASLAREATGAAAAIDTDRALPHHRTVTSSAAALIGGRRAWVVRFTVRYPGERLAWRSESGAVVVVTRPHGRPPAVFYASVPSNLGTVNLRALISSLR